MPSAEAARRERHDDLERLLRLLGMGRIMAAFGSASIASSSAYFNFIDVSPISRPPA